MDRMAVGAGMMSRTGAGRAMSHRHRRYACQGAYSHVPSTITVSSWYPVSRDCVPTPIVAPPGCGPSATAIPATCSRGRQRSSRLLQRLNSGDYECVPSELARWVKATHPRSGRKPSLPGLVRRRAAEGVLWLSDHGDDAFRVSGDMPQCVQADQHRSVRQVAAPSGLRLRSDPGLKHEVLRLLPFGTRLYVERQVDGWSAADLEGDDAVDGYIYSAFLKQADS